jgi:hypothetical protein
MNVGSKEGLIFVGESWRAQEIHRTCLIVAREGGEIDGVG